MFGSLGLPELLLLFFIVVLMFGASRIPEIGRGLGSGIQNFKAAMRGGKADEEEEPETKSSDAERAH